MKKRRTGSKKASRSSLSKKSDASVLLAISTLFLQLFAAPVMTIGLIAVGVLSQGLSSTFAFIAAAIVYICWGMWIVTNTPSQIQKGNLC